MKPTSASLVHPHRRGVSSEKQKGAAFAAPLLPLSRNTESNLGPFDPPPAPTRRLNATTSPSPLPAAGPFGRGPRNMTAVMNLGIRVLQIRLISRRFSLRFPGVRRGAPISS